MAKETALDRYRREGLVSLGSDKTFEYGRIPFGIQELDDMLGGGLPRKRLTFMTGQTNGGKSYLALQAVRSIQQMDPKAIPLWVDAELSWDSEWVAKVGVDPDRVLVAQPMSGEEAFDIVRAGEQDGVPLIVLDSVAGLIPSQMNDEDFSFGPMAWQARLVNSALPRLFPSLRYGSALLFINQVRSTMGPTALDNMPGGVGQQFFAHLILQVRRGDWIKDGDTRIGYNMQVRSRKTKVGGMPFGDVTIPFMLGGGFDMTEMYMKEAVTRGIIERNGAWYSFGDTKVMGMKGLREHFKENLEASDLLERLVSGTVEITVDESDPSTADIDAKNEIG